MHHRKLLGGVAVLAISLVAAGMSRAQTTTPTIKLDTSAVFTRGSYGLSTDTNIWVFLVNPSFETDTWGWKVSLPYIHLKGPASVVGNTGAASAARTEQGLGDVSLTVTRKLGDVGAGWHVSLAGKVKFPTADEARGLGTGRTDEAVEVDFFKKFGSVTPYGTLGYEHYGRSARYPMKSGLYASAGFASNVAPHVVAGLGANWRARIIDGEPQAFELMAFVQRKLTSASHVQVFFLHGFTDAGPNLALGATLGLTF